MILVFCAMNRCLLQSTAQSLSRSHREQHDDSFWWCVPAGVGLGVCALEALLLRVAIFMSGRGAVNNDIPDEEAELAASHAEPRAPPMVDARFALLSISLVWLLLFTGFFLRADQPWPCRVLVVLLIARSVLLRYNSIIGCCDSLLLESSCII